MSCLPTSLRTLGATLLALIRTRAQLIAVEMEEERARAGQKLVAVVLAAIFLASGLLLLAFFVIFLFWDTYRMVAAGGVTLLYLGIGGYALTCLWKINRDSPPPFAETMKEFANDWKLLRGNDE